MFVNDQRMQFYSIHVLINTILLYEIYINCLNILGAGDSTGFVALAPGTGPKFNHFQKSFLLLHILNSSLSRPGSPQPKLFISCPLG